MTTRMRTEIGEQGTALRETCSTPLGVDSATTMRAMGWWRRSSACSVSPLRMGWPSSSSRGESLMGRPRTCAADRPVDRIRAGVDDGDNFGCSG